MRISSVWEVDRRCCQHLRRAAHQKGVFCANHLLQVQILHFSLFPSLSQRFSFLFNLLHLPLPVLSFSFLQLLPLNHLFPLHLLFHLVLLFDARLPQLLLRPLSHLPLHPLLLLLCFSFSLFFLSLSVDLLLLLHFSMDELLGGCACQ